VPASSSFRIAYMVRDRPLKPGKPVLRAHVGQQTCVAATTLRESPPAPNFKPEVTSGNPNAYLFSERAALLRTHSASTKSSDLVQSNRYCESALCRVRRRFRSLDLRPAGRERHRRSPFSSSHSASFDRRSGFAAERAARPAPEHTGAARPPASSPRSRIRGGQFLCLPVRLRQPPRASPAGRPRRAPA
jgi:hypothetical protein